MRHKLFMHLVLLSDLRRLHWQTTVKQQHWSDKSVILEYQGFLLHTLLGRAKPACICTFSKVNQCIDMQILTYNFVSIPEFKHSQIITYKGQNVCSQKGLAYPLSDLIMLNHYDPDPSLGLIHHQTLRYILSSNKEKHQKPITCIFSFDLTLHKILNTCTIIPSIFSSLYT